MKIALISYEYPPDTAYGGIATYVHQVARVLYQRGHQVEIFTGSCDRAGTTSEDGIRVHRVMEPEHTNFFRPVGQLFARRHATVKFDVLEGPELLAEAREAVRLVPDIPLVIKLHSSSRLLWSMNHCPYPQPALPMNLWQHLVISLRGAPPYWSGERHRDPPLDIKRMDALERSHVLQADEITAPGQAMKDKALEHWTLNRPITIIPNPFIPSPALLSIPTNTDINVITFIGRLEIRKGVLDLARAIPHILNTHPDVKFRFVGEDYYVDSLGGMRDYLANTVLKRQRQSVEFIDAVPASTIADILATTDICVFPSIWDNFPTVCLEAMAAARGIVGTHTGGMVDMLDVGRAGLLVPPQNPEKIAEAVITLLENPSLRMQLGEVARTRLLTEYNAEHIGSLQEASYDRAIEHRRRLGARQG